MHDTRAREVKTILVATDLTPAGGTAGRAAAWLAGRLGATLHAAHAFEAVREHVESAMPGLSSARERQATEEFRSFAAANGLTGARLHVRRGSPASEIVRAAREVGADLLVVGRKDGRMGAIASRVVRESTTSVLVVPVTAATEFRRIGVGTDFGEGSDLALRRAAGLSGSLGAAELLVVNAFEVPAGHHMVASHEDALRRLSAVADQLTAEQVERVLGKAPGTKVRFRCGEGEADEVLNRIAGEERLDLLVLSAVSRTRAAAALLGHTSERVIRGAPCAVWAEKAPGLAQGFLDAMRELLK